MSAKPLAEVYERLKEFRRQNAEIPSRIGHRLRDMYTDIVRPVFQNASPILLRSSMFRRISPANPTNQQA